MAMIPQALATKSVVSRFQIRELKKIAFRCWFSAGPFVSWPGLAPHRAAAISFRGNENLGDISLALAVPEQIEFQVVLPIFDPG